MTQCFNGLFYPLRLTLGLKNKTPALKQKDPFQLKESLKYSLLSNHHGSSPSVIAPLSVALEPPGPVDRTDRAVAEGACVGPVRYTRRYSQSRRGKPE